MQANSSIPNRLQSLIRAFHQHKDPHDLQEGFPMLDLVQTVIVESGMEFTEERANNPKIKHKNIQPLSGLQLKTIVSELNDISDSPEFPEAVRNSVGVRLDLRKVLRLVAEEDHLIKKATKAYLEGMHLVTLEREGAKDLDDVYRILKNQVPHEEIYFYYQLRQKHLEQQRFQKEMMDAYKKIVALLPTDFGFLTIYNKPEKQPIVLPSQEEVHRKRLIELFLEQLNNYSRQSEVILKQIDECKKKEKWSKANPNANPKDNPFSAAHLDSKFIYDFMRALWNDAGNLNMLEKLNQSTRKVFNLRCNCTEMIEYLAEQGLLDLEHYSVFNYLIDQFEIKPKPNTVIAYLKALTRIDNRLGLFVERGFFDHNFSIEQLSEIMKCLSKIPFKIYREVPGSPACINLLDKTFETLISQLPKCRESDPKFALSMANALCYLDWILANKVAPEIKLRQRLQAFIEGIPITFLDMKDQSSTVSIRHNYAHALAACALSPVLYRSVVYPHETALTKEMIKPAEIDFSLLGLTEFDFKLILETSSIDIHGCYISIDPVFLSDWKNKLGLPLADGLCIPFENTTLGESLRTEFSDDRLFQVIQLQLVINNKELVNLYYKKIIEYFKNRPEPKPSEIWTYLDRYRRAYDFIIATTTKLNLEKNFDHTDLGHEHVSFRVAGKEYNYKKEEFIQTIQEDCESLNVDFQSARREDEGYIRGIFQQALWINKDLPIPNLMKRLKEQITSFYEKNNLKNTLF